MSADYNEYEPYAAEWLRNLIKQGLIADGEVDGRSIVDVHPSDLRGFDQCHFFAGIGVWSYALRLAGWSDDRPVWTGSCPCQPFSAAGKGKGFEDERHLWPVFHRLIAECRPAVVFGEQVASKDGLQWLDAVCADMEASGYAIGAADLCAAGVGAPHIRQRLWFVGERLGDADRPRHEGHGLQSVHGEWQGREPLGGSAGSSAAGGLGHDNDAGLEGQRSGHQAEGGWIGATGSVAEAGELGGLADASEGGREERGSAWLHGDREPRHDSLGRGEACGLADANGRNTSAEGIQRGGQQRQQQEDGGAGYVADAIGDGRAARWNRDHRRHDGNQPDAGRGNDRPRPTNGFWNYADWLHCRDGKWRPVGPWTFPLAHGAASRVGRLRAYGNAIVPQVAAEVIGAFMEARP